MQFFVHAFLLYFMKWSDGSGHNFYPVLISAATGSERDLATLHFLAVTNPKQTPLVGEFEFE